MSAALSTRGLRKVFGSTVAVEGLDLDVPAGGVVGLVGPNGSGKSTTIRMLLGLVRPSAGTAHVLGHPVTTPVAYAGRVGALVEAPVHVPGLSGRRDVEVLAALRGVGPGEVDRVLEVVGLTDRQQDRVDDYSLGMKQRLGIAIALLGDPDLVLLDEPTNGLDPSGITEVRALVARLASTGRTVVVSSHLLSEIQAVCDHLVVLSVGRLRYAGTLSGFLDLGTRGVRVTSEDPPLLRATLDRLGHAHRPQGDAVLVDLPPGQAAELNRDCHAHGVTLSSLAGVRDTVEDVFLRMTAPPPDGSTRPQDDVRPVEALAA